jgi:hypothetical protein
MHWSQKNGAQRLPLNGLSLMLRESEGVQAGESEDALQERVRNSTSIYSTRRDLLSLKDRLFDLVEDPEYWNCLACFLHGQCSKPQFDEAMRGYLRTNEVKLLHNELIRSIIFNAHFAMRPPTNVTLPPLAPPPTPKRPSAATSARLERTLVTNTAGDLRHLPSAGQLSERMGVLLGSKKLGIDKRAAVLLFAQMKRYALHLLQRSCAFVNVKGERRRDTRITAQQLLHVVSWNRELASVISPAVFTKYAVVAP